MRGIATLGALRFMLIVAVAVVAGCSGEPADRPKLAPVSGRVTYKGKAVEGAIVVFHGKKSPRTSSGKTNSDGQFKLTMFNTNDGAVLGENVVTITKPKATNQQSQPISIETGGEAYTKAMASAASGAGSDADSELPATYSDPSKSGLARTVAEGNNDFVFDLE